MEQLTKNQAVATSQEAVQNQNEPQLRDENAHNDKSVHGVLNPTYQAGLRRDAVQPDIEAELVGALRLSPLRRGLAIDSTVDIFTFYVPHRHVYGEQWIKFMKDGVNATPLPTVNTTGYIDHAAFLGTINPDTNKIPKHLFQGYLNIYN